MCEKPPEKSSSWFEGAGHVMFSPRTVELCKQLSQHQGLDGLVLPEPPVPAVSLPGWAGGQRPSADTASAERLDQPVSVGNILCMFGGSESTGCLEMHPTDKMMDETEAEPCRSRRPRPGP